MWNRCSIIICFVINFVLVYPVVNLTHWLLPSEAYQNHYVHYVLWHVYTALGMLGVPQTEVNADALMSGGILLFTGLCNGIIFPLVPGLRHINSYLRGEYTPVEEEATKLEAVRRYVEQKSGHDMQNWTLRVSGTQEYNAYAIGWRRIVIYQPVLHEFSVEEIAGIVAHEMGHSYHGDTKYIGMNYAFSIVGWFCHWVLRSVARLFFVLARIPFIGILFCITGWILIAFVQLYNWLEHIPVFILNFISRRIEFRADAYALELNLGQELIWGLEALRRRNKDGTGWDALFSDHPNFTPRIERLKHALGSNSHIKSNLKAEPM